MNMTSADFQAGYKVSILVALHHLTHYKYERPISLGPQIVRLRPAPHSRTKIPSYSLKVSPSQHFINWQQDPHGNWFARFVFPEKTDELRIEVDLIADMSVINPFDFFVESFAETFPFAYSDDVVDELAAYTTPEPTGPLLRTFLDGLPKSAPRTVDMLVALNARLQHEIRYLIRMEPGVQTPEQTLALKSGSCRDSGMAAGADRAPSRSRRAVRLRLPDPAQVPTSNRSTDRRARPTTSATCTPGRRSIFPAPAGSVST